MIQRSWTPSYSSMNGLLEVTVNGEARPAGALAIGLAKDGTRYLHHRDGRELGKWRKAIRAEVAPRVSGGLATCAVSIAATFYVKRPALSDQAQRRGPGQARPSAARRSNRRRLPGRLTGNRTQSAEALR